ncbi:MAG: hypothetical protein NC409_11445 [Clostridium sp.]|nr:hypothetical protein [Clostridium sp.]
MAFNQYNYQNDYNKEHYARLSVIVQKEDKDALTKHWKSKGFKSFSAYANELIRKDMNENSTGNVNISTINNEDGGTINIG